MGCVSLQPNPESSPGRRIPQSDLHRCGGLPSSRPFHPPATPPRIPPRKVPSLGAILQEQEEPPTSPPSPLPRSRPPTRPETMPSAPRPARLLLLLGLSFVSCLLPSHAGGALAPPVDPPTAYEALERYGFPRGILPVGVKSYLLRKDGSFEAYLGGYCDFAVAGRYTLHYRKKITGRLDVDGPTRAIRELKGVWVKLFFVWLPIGYVVRGDAELSFHVGPLSATFPVSAFAQCPRCRCGFDCAAAAAAVLPGSLAA